VAGGDVRRLFASPLLRLAGYLADTAVTAPLMVAALYAAGVMEATDRAGVGIFLTSFTWVMVASVAYYIIPTAVWGRTLGKWLVGTQVVGPDGRGCGWKRACVRGLVAALADALTQTLGIGLLDQAWLLWDPQRQALHDKAADTRVVSLRGRKPLTAFILSLVGALGVQAALVFGAIWPFVIQGYYVPSASMRPTLLENDRLMVSKLSYRYGEMRRGDIIVFRAPPNALLANPVENPDPHAKKDFIKRLIALPGDTVKVKAGRLWLKRPGEQALRPLEEPYVAEPMREDWGPVTVPEGQALVFGDNRNNSNDSRKWCEPKWAPQRRRAEMQPSPFLPLSNIKGRALYRFWPIQRWGETPRGSL